MEKVCIQGGYKTQTVTQIANLLSSYDAGTIGVRALRVYFAALCMVAARDAAKRSATQETKKGSVVPSYQLKELARLTGLSLRVVSREIRALKSVDLMHFSITEIIFTETALDSSGDLSDALSGGRSRARPVPLPRSILRHLAKCQRISTLKTVLAYAVRGLTIARCGGEVTGKGSVKASWIAEVMGLSIRSVQSVRAEIIALEWISADESSTQWKLNRTGAYFEINLAWKPKAKESSKRVSHRYPSHCGALNGPCAHSPMENSLAVVPGFAPPLTPNCTEFAYPYKDKKTLLTEESKYQEARISEPTGIFTKPKKGRGTLFDVKLEDLFSFTRVEALYFEACELGLVNPCEASALNVLSAAIRARSAKTGDPARIFAGIIRRKLWAHITQGEEEQARKALMKYREEDSGRFMFSRREAA